MSAHGIRARAPRRFVRTTDSNHRLPVAENLLARDFEPEGPNESWCSDITYVPTGEGWLYLAVVEDLFSRMVVRSEERRVGKEGRSTASPGLGDVDAGSAGRDEAA